MRLSAVRMLEFLIIIVVLITFAFVSRSLMVPRTSFAYRKRKARGRMERLRMRGEADYEVKAKLVQMLGGDRNEAERLVARQRFGKGGQYSENYYWSQAMQALEAQNSQKPDGASDQS